MFFKCQGDAAVGRQCSSRKSRTGSSGSDHYVVMIAVNQNTADIIFISWEYNRIGFVSRASSVVAVCYQVRFVTVYILLADYFAKRFDMFAVYHQMEPIS